MGVYLNLSILPYAISPEAWQGVYAETLALLSAYPGGMMGLQREDLGFAKRTFYSRRIEREVDRPDRRHWHVVGDFASREKCESFVFYRDLDHYRSAMSGSDEPPGDLDILEAIVEGKKALREVLRAKTQGRAYHLPVLAVGMWVEHRFPQHAAVGGDIDVHQAKRAQAYVKTALGENIALPLCVDAPRLFAELEARYSGHAVLNHFRHIFRGDSRDKFEALYRFSRPAIFVPWFLEQLRDYLSPDQLGALEWMMNWLNASEDLNVLCELACLDERGPQFDPVAFAKALASTWISIDESLREAMTPWTKPRGEADTVWSQLGSVFLDMSGLKGRKLALFRAEDAVVETLQGIFRNDAEAIEAAFRTKTAEIRTQLGQLREPMARRLLNAEEGAVMAETLWNLPDSPSGLSELQRLAFGALAVTVGDLYARTMAKDPNMLGASPDATRRILMRCCERKGVILTEETWIWMDAETDWEFLRIALILAMIDGHREDFVDLRREVLKNRAWFEAFAQLRQDESLRDTCNALWEAGGEGELER